MKQLAIYKASAGSGKTFTLAVEYISLLAMNPAEYQNILAVTFTNKATAEMKQRILATLYAVCHGLPSAEDYVVEILRKVESMRQMECYGDEPYASALSGINRATLPVLAGKALSNIIHDYSRFRIETIDSFFQGIVRELASELDLSANMKVELDETEVLSTAVDEIIDNLSEGSSDFRSVIQFIEDKINTGHSWQVDKVVKDFGRNIFKENYLIHGEDVRRTITNRSVIDRYRNKIQDNLRNLQDQLTDKARQFLAAYEQAGCTPQDCTRSIVTFFEKVAEGRFTMPTSSSEGTFSSTIREYANDADKWFKANSKQRDALMPSVTEDLMPRVEDIFRAFATYKAHRCSVAAASQYLYHLMLLNEISERVKTINNEKNTFLLSETANFLRNVINNQNIPFIYEKTGSVIRHIMIDEFQDTSALQWDNFKPLILGSLAAGGSCLIVGDVKQSIYRFRNSDWQILNNIESDRELKRHIRQLPAEYNFRSAPVLVDFNNKFFSRAVTILNEDYRQAYNIDCSSLLAAYGDVEQKARHTDGTGFVMVENIDYHGIETKTKTKTKTEIETKTKTKTKTETETEIGTKTKTETKTETGTESGEDVWDLATPCSYETATLQRIQLTVKELMAKGVSPCDITILIRTNREVALISDYFGQHRDVLDVKIVSDDAFRLDASPAITLIIHALRSLASPDDIFQLATLAYYHQTLRGQRPDPHPSATSNPFVFETAEDIDPLLPQGFSRGRRDALQCLSLSEQVEEICQAFRVEQIERQDGYLHYFNDLVRQHADDHPTDIDTFLQAWDDKLSAKTIPNASSDGVRIMTMHKSKGLEFHTVIIPSCSWSIKPKDSEIIWCTPRGKPYDTMPLLPISVSRATADSIFADSRNSEALKTLVDNINVLYVAFTRAKNNLVILTGNKPGESPDIDAPADNAQALLVKAMPAHLVQDDIEGVITTYRCGAIVPSKKRETTHSQNVMESTYTPVSARFVSCPSYAEFRQSYESDIFLTSQSAVPVARLHAERMRLINQGNLYHSIFQLVHTIDDVPHAVHTLAQRGCFGSHQQACSAERTVATLIRSVSAEHPQWFSPQWRVLNERSILLSQDNTLASRRPDRVIVNGSQAIIIDYKTARGELVKRPDGSLQAPRAYVRQLQTYAALLQQMGYDVVESYLWYILEDPPALCPAVHSS